MTFNSYIVIVTLLLLISNTYEIKLDLYDYYFTSNDDILKITDLNKQNYNIKTSLGRFLTIKIKGVLNSTYGWYLLNNLNTNNILIPENLNISDSTKFIADIDENGEILTSGYFSFVFIPVNTGTISLNFIYKQYFKLFGVKIIKVKINVNKGKNL